MDSTSALHTFHRRPASIPAACPQQEGMGAIKGIRDVLGSIGTILRSARAEMTATTGQAIRGRYVCTHSMAPILMVSSARVGVVFSTWTCVCFSGGGAVRESQPLCNTPWSPSLTRSAASARVGWRAVCTPVLARHAGTPRRSIVYPRNGRKGPDIGGQRLRLLQAAK